MGYKIIEAHCDALRLLKFNKVNQGGLVSCQIRFWWKRGRGGLRQNMKMKKSDKEKKKEIDKNKADK